MSKVYDFRKLPKWAREHIESLNHRLDDANATIDQLTKSEPTRVHLDPYYHGGRNGDGPLSYLPERVSVRYLLGKDLKDWSEFVDVRMRDGGLYIYGGDSIEILPESGNTVTIKLRDKP